jgi:hypothetical protein
MAWALAEKALAECTVTAKQLLPAQQNVKIFSNGAQALQLYEEEMDNENIFNVRLVGQTGEKVAFAGIDLALLSEWFRAYLRNM